MSLPGWYPDPWGDYEHRYWDGRQWTDHVASFGHQTEDPLTEPVLPDQEAMLWSQGESRLSTHRVWVMDGVTRHKQVEIPLWMVADVEVTVNAGQYALGTGRVALHVEYAGYTGRSHYVMTGVTDPRAVGAVARKWASRCRRSAAAG